ncbi:MAG: hypothetical protein Q8O89_00040 [Nanoarchaeota archaeon]|nr:hypothetical protein [Nanoarchaeota archaeon]
MEECCTPQCKAMKLLIAGLILILVTVYTTWNIWIVIGAMMVIKAIIMFAMPNCPCHGKDKKSKR